MKILQVTNGFPPTTTAGVEQYAYQLSRALSARHDVRIFCRESNPRLDDYEIIDDVYDGLPVRRVVNDFQHASHIRDFYLDQRIESIFRDTLAEWQSDVIHFQHCIGLSASLLNVAAEVRIPYLLTLHDYWFICSQVQLFHRGGYICPGPVADVDCYDCIRSPRDLLRPLRRTPLYRFLRTHLSDDIKRRTLTILSRIIPNLPPPDPEQALSPFKERNEYMLSLLSAVPVILIPSRFVGDIYAKHGVPDEQMMVLPLGLDLRPWHGVLRNDEPAIGDELRVGYIGTLLRHKGVHVLVEAFRHLENPKAMLRIYGFPVPGDPYIGELKKQVSQDSRVQLMGRYQHQDLPTILSRIDVVVIPSLWHETFSIVAREALLSGTPVIASRIGALPEIVRDGENGFLVPRGDIAALHAVLSSLSADPVLLSHLREGARVSAEEIKGMDDQAREIELIYEKLAST